MTYSQASLRLSTGPAEHFDINPNGESFALIGELFERFGDICKVEPLTHKAPAYIIAHSDYIKHVLVGRAQNYTKGESASSGSRCCSATASSLAAGTSGDRNGA